MEFFNSITNDEEMDLEIKEAEVSKSERLKAAINSINMANEMLRENQRKIEMEVLQDIIPLGLFVKMKTNSVESVIITKQEVQEMVKEHFPSVAGNQMELYRFEAKLRNGNTEYYFHQMYFDPNNEIQKTIYQEAFNSVEVQIINGEDSSKKEICRLMEQYRR